MEFSARQKQIIDIVKKHEPITGDQIASIIGLSKPTLRSDLALLTMTGVLYARPKVGYIYSGQPVEPLLFDRLFDSPVAYIMIAPVMIRPETTVKDAVTLLFMEDVGSLYVVNSNEELVGILSRKDLLRATVNQRDTSVPAAMIMTRMPNIITSTKDESVLAAGNKLISHQIDSLPVIEEGSKNRVVGKVSKTNIMRYFIQEGNQVNTTT